jgi:alpha-tubulin suppressor-like RCC1 family protein
VVGIGDATSAFAGTGFLQSCVVHGGGSVSCWGSNDHGQLGDGTLVDTPVPHAVLGLYDATNIAVGYILTCAAQQSGKVSCWGWNANGALGTGNGQADSLPEPVDVVAIDDGVQVVAGNHYACARSVSGVVRCWGYFGHGQLGVGEMSTEQVLVPTPVVGMIDAIWLAGGTGHACAVRKNGHVACWGRNYYGQVGDGTTLDRAIPFEVPGIDDAVMVAAGAEHTCAVSTSRGLLCWGANFSGQLGDGSSETRPKPTPVACPEMAPRP